MDQGRALQLPGLGGLRLVEILADAGRWSELDALEPVIGDQFVPALRHIGQDGSWSLDHFGGACHLQFV